MKLILAAAAFAWAGSAGAQTASSGEVCMLDNSGHVVCSSSLPTIAATLPPSGLGAAVDACERHDWKTTREPKACAEIIAEHKKQLDEYEAAQLAAQDAAGRALVQRWMEGRGR